MAEEAKEVKPGMSYEDIKTMIIGSEEIPEELNKHLKDSKKPVLDFKSKDEFGEAYVEFYNTQVLG